MFSPIFPEKTCVPFEVSFKIVPEPPREMIPILHKRMTAGASQEEAMAKVREKAATDFKCKPMDILIQKCKAL